MGNLRAQQLGFCTYLWIISSGLMAESAVEFYHSRDV